MDSDILKKGLKSLNLNADEMQITQLQRFLSELMLFNKQFNLIGAHSKEDIIIKHMLDSLVAVDLLKKQNPVDVADVGSGAGFPGIPLAIFLPNVQFFLIERRERRAIFLQNVRAVAGLRNITVLCIEAANVTRRFSTVTCRALAKLDTALLSTMNGLTGDAGSLLLYKGDPQKAEAELAELRDYLTIQRLQTTIIPAAVPFLDEKRCLVEITKSV